MHCWLCCIALLIVSSNNALAADPPVTAIRFHPLHPDQFFALRGRQVMHWQLSDSPQLQQTLTFEQPLLNFAGTADHLFVVGGDPAEQGMLATLPLQQPWTEDSIQYHNPVIFTDVIFDLAIDTDTNRWGLASLDGQAIIVSANSREPLSTATTTTVALNGHSAGVTGIAWIDHEHVLTSSRDQTIRVWDARQGQLLRTLNNHTGEVIAITQRPGQRSTVEFASLSNDGTVRWWQPMRGRMMRFYRFENDTPTCMAWNETGASLIVATRGGNVVALDPQTAQITATLGSFDRWISAIAVGSDGQILVGDMDGRVELVEQ